MKVHVDASRCCGIYQDPTCWQNSTLRYTPPGDFPPFLASRIGRAKLMRVFITLDEFWDYETDTIYPDFEIGVARRPVEQMRYPYDWALIVPAPYGTRFEEYLTSHAANAEELLLNVRRCEREVADGVITCDQYEEVFYRAVEYCKRLAPNIRYIECCNEVDIADVGVRNAQEYVNMYLRARSAILRLNEKYQYPIPLEIGGYAAAHPLHKWDMMEDVMRLLVQNGLGKKPMDFCSYHMYNVPENIHLVREGKDELTRLGGVEKLQLILQQHHQMIQKLGLTDVPVFLNEIGKARATGVDGDSLHNAAGVLTYLNAFCMGGLPGAYPSPWCTFHNPKLQMSYTQYLRSADGSYQATPNGIALEMLHGLHGERLQCTVTDACGADARYYALAVGNEEEYAVLCVNPTGDTVGCYTEISGLPKGEYRMEIYRCNFRDNNCISGTGDGTLQMTEQLQYAVTAESILHTEVLDKDGFVLLKLHKI